MFMSHIERNCVKENALNIYIVLFWEHNTTLVKGHVLDYRVVRGLALLLLSDWIGSGLFEHGFWEYQRHERLS